MLLSTILAAKSTANPLVSFAPILLIGVVMYFLLIRPQRRRQRDAMSLLKQLHEGDEVITNGGIYGFINAIDGDTIWLDIADGVEIRVHRSSVARKIDPAKEPAGGPVGEGDASGSTTTETKPASKFTRFQKAPAKTAEPTSAPADPAAAADPADPGGPSPLDGQASDDTEN